MIIFSKSENQPNISSDLHFSADNTDGKQKELTNIIQTAPTTDQEKKNSKVNTVVLTAVQIFMEGLLGAKLDDWSSVHYAPIRRFRTSRIKMCLTIPVLHNIIQICAFSVISLFSKIVLQKGMKRTKKHHSTVPLLLNSSLFQTIH